MEKLVMSKRHTEDTYIFYIYNSFNKNKKRPVKQKTVSPSKVDFQTPPIKGGSLQMQCLLLVKL